ncbi:aspartate kinase [Leptospira sp. GIMC2001]|uniref:aspartate kinase n=1 Tax=Leptospira sp. GIMC2001 TaxID=1513297 RepID=UPI00234AEFFA|nr:aspartate kinase [Leptospira sp. GIMC2001]WCL49651.1 aspartate kinase [Leptospira sp. GIMC2001]
MSLTIVQKYGGTSVGDTTKIKNVANRIKSYYEAGKNVAVVVSAMGHTTDELVSLADQITDNPPKREMDMLLSTGEQVSVALLAMALESIGVPAVSFTGSQIKMMTDGNHSNAKIDSIDRTRIDKAFESKRVAIIAGFQGIDKEENITTLGRGGSDTTAVAIAAALGADECEIYTDVNGVYTTDPNKVPGAKMHKQITYEEMLELASLGAGVLHSRSVEMAMNYGVTIHVRSSFHREPGTLVVSEDKIMEKMKVSGVTVKSDQARITIPNVKDQPGIAAKLFSALSAKDVIVDVIVQSSPHDGINTISFTTAKKDVITAKPILEDIKKDMTSGEIEIDDSIAILSAVGVGMKSHVGVAAKMFQSLADAGINILMISTSEIKISCVIPQSKAQDGLKAIHSAFGLDQI